MREAGKAGFIEDVELWLSFVIDRNLIIHTYEDQTAEQLNADIKSKFLPALQELIEQTPPSVVS